MFKKKDWNVYNDTNNIEDKRIFELKKYSESIADKIILVLCVMVILSYAVSKG